MRLARDGLRCALADDWERAGQVLQRISDECGSIGISRAILAWSDTLIAKVPQLKNVNERDLEVTFMNSESGAVSGASGVPANVRWATFVLIARARDDEEAWSTLMGSLPDDPQLTGEYVFSVLTLVALNLDKANQLQRLQRRNTQGQWN